MAEKPEARSQSQSSPPQTTQSPSPTPLALQHLLPTVDPAKTINYRQDGVDRSKK